MSVGSNQMEAVVIIMMAVLTERLEENPHKVDAKTAGGEEIKTSSTETTL